MKTLNFVKLAKNDIVRFCSADNELANIRCMLSRMSRPWRKHLYVGEGSSVSWHRTGFVYVYDLPVDNRYNELDYLTDLPLALTIKIK